MRLESVFVFPLALNVHEIWNEYAFKIEILGQLDHLSCSQEMCLHVGCLLCRILEALEQQGNLGDALTQPNQNGVSSSIPPMRYYVDKCKLLHRLK